MDHGPAHDLLMTAAAGLLAGGGLLFVALAFRERRMAAPALVAEPPAPPPGIGVLLTLLAAALAVASGLIHLAAAPTHFEELGALGWGFVGATIFQVSWALAYAISPTRPVALWGVAGSLAIALAWLWSRTLGLPLGPAAGVPEAVGLPDAIATLFELMLVALLVVRLTGAERRLADALGNAGSLSLIAAVPALGLLVVATSLAVTFALSHTHGPGEGHATEPAGITADPGH